MNIYTIYRATNTINGKCYIGFDSSWPKRLYEHKQSSKNADQVFYRAIRKYGWEKFSWEILYQSNDGIHTLSVMEPFFIKENNSYIRVKNSNGYNMTIGGEGSLGYIHTKKSRENIGKSLIGKTKGRKKPERSQEHKNNMSIAKIGSIPWNKGKITGQIPWNKGKKGVYSDETLRLMKTNGGKAKGKRWYNDGEKSYYIFPEEALSNYVIGRINKKRNIKKVTCPHCYTSGGGGNMSRYHFDNCKLKP